MYRNPNINKALTLDQYTDPKLCVRIGMSSGVNSKVT